MKQLTNAQSTLLQAIRRLKHAMGISPTVQELAVELGMKGSSVFRGLKRLENKGYIRRQARKARSIEIVDSVGESSKLNASSVIACQSHVKRSWGVFSVLHELPRAKLKIIHVQPLSSISQQRHQHREKMWFVASGEGRCIVGNMASKLEASSIVHVKSGVMHELWNTGSDDLVVYEVVYDKAC